MDSSIPDIKDLDQKVISNHPNQENNENLLTKSVLANIMMT